VEQARAGDAGPPFLWRVGIGGPSARNEPPLTLTAPNWDGLGVDGGTRSRRSEYTYRIRESMTPILPQKIPVRCSTDLIRRFATHNSSQSRTNASHLADGSWCISHALPSAALLREIVWESGALDRDPKYAWHSGACGESLVRRFLATAKNVTGSRRDRPIDPSGGRLDHRESSRLLRFGGADSLRAPRAFSRPNFTGNSENPKPRLHDGDRDCPVQTSCLAGSISRLHRRGHVPGELLGTLLQGDSVNSPASQEEVAKPPC
jgi:hypothetical protein